MNNGFPKRRPISDFSVDETGNLQKNAYVADKNTWELTYWLSGEHVSYLGEKYFFDKVK